MRRLLFLLPALLLVGLAAVFAVGLRRDPAALPSQLIGKPLPAFTLPALLPGQPGLASADLRGEPRLLNVWASWCAPCRAEHPMLTRLTREGVTLDAVNWKDAPADARGFLNELGNPFRRIGSDPQGRAGIDLGVSGAPETFLIDRHGRVRYRHAGPITPDVWRDTLAPIYETMRSER